MSESNTYSDESDQHMMGDYSHVGDESVQYTDEDSISLDDLSSHPHNSGEPNPDNDAGHHSENLQQPPDMTDQHFDSFPYVDYDIQPQMARVNPHTDDEMNRFLRPFGTTTRNEEDSYSAIMRQWNGEREEQERQKNETMHSAQEITDKRNAVGLYHNVPGDFAETLIFYDPFTFNSIVDEYMETILSNVDNRSVDEWLTILKRFNEYHKDDNLIPRSHRTFLKRLEDGPFDYMTQSDWELLVKVEGFMYYEWSVYPDVRAITVPVNEENDEDYETFRVYLIGIAWGIVACISNTITYSLSYSYSVDLTVPQVLIALTGQLWAFLPRISIPLSGHKKLVINSGRSWSFREQMLATLTMAISQGSPFAQDIIIQLSNKNFFHQSGADNYGFIILLILSTQFLGFAIAGLQRAFFVYPSKMVFFDSLYINSLSRALITREPREKVNGWILRRTEFSYLFAGIFSGWFWIVSFAFRALSDFSWPIWISPNNIDLNAITGTQSGLGFFPISSFDPARIELSSLYTPWNALWQYTAGFFVTTVAVIIMWYSNTANTAYLPINETIMFDNTAKSYNKSRVLNADNTLNVNAYRDYSMVFYGATALVGRGVTFMYYPAQLLSCALNYWSDFAISFKSFKHILHSKKNVNVLDGFDDRFSRTARSYPEAPEWWYFVIFFACFGIAISVVEHWEFVETPIYSIVISSGIALIFMYPMESLRARTTYTFDIKALLMLINGIIFEDNPIGIMMSTLYGTALSSQNNNYIDNLKIGHYAGLSPRSMFRCQALSLFICSFVQAGLIQWQASGQFDQDFCNPLPGNNTKFTCKLTRYNYENILFQVATSSKRIFHNYPYLKWTFLIGALYPLLLWITRQVFFRMKSKSFFKRLIDCDILVVLDDMVWLNSGMSWLPFNTWQYVGSNFLVGILWHKWIRPKYPQWFAKCTYLFYNAVLVAYSSMELIYVIAENSIQAFNLPWWGNDASNNTLDAKYAGNRLRIPEKGYFGPDKHW